MDFNPVNPRPSKKYLLIPEEDWIFMKAHSDFSIESLFDKKLFKDYEEIKSKKYQSVEHPF